MSAAAGDRGAVPSTGLAALAELLPPAKSALAARLFMAGGRLDGDAFRSRGLALTRAEEAALQVWESGGLTTRVVARVVAADGTVRLVLGLPDGKRIECVAMPVGAVCVSTQVGCAVRCRFCASGLDGLERNLAVHEIVEQVVHARRELRIDRMVLMGMGEPSHNLGAVLPAIATISEHGRISNRRITLSTVGSVRAFERLLQAPVRPCLALSLHSADPERRRELLPHAPAEDLRTLVAAADAYGRAMGTPVQFEWTLLDGINDGERDVEQLCGLIAGVRGYVNFIVWNAVDGLPFAAPPRERIVALVRAVKARGILATIRDSNGADAQAACGQLRRR